MQYWTCPLCGANLDSGEKCDCEKISRQQEEFYSQRIKAAESGQFVFQWKQEETAVCER